MSAVFGRRRRLVVASAVALFFAAGLAASAASAAPFTVNVDQAHIMRLPDRVATIVIGNPLIADASLQSGGILVVTGKSFGSTNMLALDRAGKTILDTTIQVMGPPGGDLVVEIPDAKVLFAGDILWNHTGPTTIDGTVSIWTADLARLETLSDTVFVPGHGAIAGT